ncbi:MAG: hypothetical protein SGJ11_06695 [Phycisphaerae bacterium]|nr:hypothetical protein [Phycisphaerae bacterium]
MTHQEIDLLPAETRERVTLVGTTARAYRTALALTMVAAASAIGAAFVRADALEARDRAERTLDDARANEQFRRRLEADISTLHAAFERVRRIDADVPSASIVSALADALPATAHFDRIELWQSGNTLRGAAQGAGDDGAAETLAVLLAAMQPFQSVYLDRELPVRDPQRGAFRLRFELPTDRAFVLVTDASAETEDDNDH